MVKQIILKNSKFFFEVWHNSLGKLKRESDSAFMDW